MFDMRNAKFLRYNLSVTRKLVINIYYQKSLHFHNTRNKINMYYRRKFKIDIRK